jgi:ribosomal-protein-alanine N-acetyltransferase
MRVRLETPSLRREAEFLCSVRGSRGLHRGYVSPPATPAAYRNYLKVLRRKNQQAFFVVLIESGALVGVVSIDDIVGGSFQYASLGYYVFSPYDGQGLMREGMVLAIRHCFREIRLHRLEVAIQPANRRSIKLVAGLGFRHEGLALRFVKVFGRWRDHERWALLADEWRAIASARRASSVGAASVGAASVGAAFQPRTQNRGENAAPKPRPR